MSTGQATQWGAALAHRVYLHIGVPKSGTSYLQDILWRHSDRLRGDGVLLPGDGYTDHRWGSLVVRQDNRLKYRDPAARGAWERIVTDVAAWPGTAVVSHEFYGGASREQARRAIGDLAPAQVHLVLTARDSLRVFTSAWQETVKYGKTTPLDDFALELSEDPQDIWNWRALDPAEVLARWGGLVPPERVHVLPVPRLDRPSEKLWARFAGLFLPEPDEYVHDDVTLNASIGLVECEVMRRVGPHLEHLAALPRSTWVRKYLAETLLGSRPGEKFWPSASVVENCRARSHRTVQAIASAGYHVIGDLGDLQVPPELPQRRTPTDVTDAEVANVSAELVARLLIELRSTTKKLRTSRQRVENLERKQTLRWITALRLLAQRALRQGRRRQ